MAWLVGAYFWYLGAWPIFAFCGLAGLGVLLLTYLNERAGRASELVMLTADRVRIVRSYGRVITRDHHMAGRTAPEARAECDEV